MNTSVNTVNRSTSKPAAYTAPYGKGRTHKPKSNNHYVRDRFNNLQWIGNPITNHKVEQLLRAALYPERTVNYNEHLGVQGDNWLGVYARNAQVITEQKDLDLVQVGYADEYGYRLAPETNSWLIRNGIKPNAFLLALSQVQIEGVPALLSRDGKLYMVFCALFVTAYEAIFAGKNLNDEYGKYIKKHGVPKHFTVQGVYFDPKQLYEVV